METNSKRKAGFNISNWGGELLWFFLAGLLIFPILRFGLSNDEGLFAVQAQRVLSGELPVTDFATAYMGGNSFIFAGLFKLFGESFYSLRIGFLLTVMGIAAITFHLAKQVLKEKRWAHIATLFGLSISITFYPYVGAGWYALLFSLCSFSAFLHALDKEHADPAQRNLFIASGFLAGLCLLTKQTIALYTGFPMLIILTLYHLNNTTEPTEKSDTPIVKIGLALLLILPVFYLFYIFQNRLSPSNLIHFILPNVMISVLVKKQFFSKQKATANGILKSFAWIVLGGIVPIIFYIMPYLLNGKLTQLLQASFSSPSTYLSLYDVPFHSQALGNITIAYFLITAIACSRQWFAGICFLLMFALFSYNIIFVNYRGFMQGSMAVLTQGSFILAMVLTIVLSIKSFKKNSSTLNKPVIYLFIYSLWMLVNIYPVYMYPYYGFCIIPLVIVFVAGAQHLWQKETILPLAKVLICLPIVFYTIFGYLHLYRIIDFTQETIILNPFEQFSKSIDNPKFNVRVQQNIYQSTREMMRFINTHIANKTDLYFLGNQGAEFYFLTDLVNPTPYEFHQHSLSTDGQPIIDALEKHQTQFVVIPLQKQSTQPENDFALQEKLKAYVDTHYRDYQTISHYKILKRTTL